MSPTRTPERMVLARVRASHVLVIGALCGLAGFAAGSARRRPAGRQPPEVLPRLPSSSAPAALAASPRRRLPATRIATLLALAALLFFASAAFSAEPHGKVQEQVIDPRIAAKRATAARVAAKRAAAARVALLRRLQLAGINARRVGLPPREQQRVRRLASLSLLPQPRPSDEAVALERYFQALGPDAILAGLETARSRLQEEVLSDPRIRIYPGGRLDISSGRVDVRVLALLEYLAQAHGSVTVSSIITGHALYVRDHPGVVSAHVYGRAVDISAVSGIPILGHQQLGGITEQVIREILSLPSAVHPKQVISLLDLGGPSFPLPDHGDHIHVGY